MKRLLLLTIYCITLNINAQTKRALIVAVGDYPTEKTGWSDLSSIKDYEIIYQMLLNQDFKEENIDRLLDKDATAEGLDQKFSELLSKCEKGDMIYFHFSGHGQQVTDTEQNINSISDNEPDGYDEALVMFFAPKKCTTNYDMSEHYIDDRLNYWITEIREKIVDGHVIIVMDACHSGTASRGISDNIIRGTGVICEGEGSDVIFGRKEENIKGLEFEFDPGENIGSLVVFSGCKAEERNKEYKEYNSNVYYGSLSYAFVKGMEKLSQSDATYYELFGYINEFIETSVNQYGGPQQHPQIEPLESKFLKIFDGEFIPSDLIYNIKSHRDEIVVIDAGIINSNIKLDDIVEFRLIGIIDGDPRLSGKVIKTGNFSSEIFVYDIEEEDNLTTKEYHKFKDMFECTLPYSYKIIEQKLKVNVDVENKKYRKEILKMLNNTDYLEFDKNAKYIISDSSDAFVIKISYNNVVVQKMKPSNFNNPYFKDVLSSLVEIESVLKNDLDSEEVDVTFKMGEKEESVENRFLGEFAVGDIVFLKFKNRKNKKAYIYFYEIDPLRKLTNLLKDTFILEPNKSLSISSPLTDKGGLGNHILLLISSDQPINLENLNKLSQKTNSRGKNDPHVDWKKYVYTLVER